MQRVSARPIPMGPFCTSSRMSRQTMLMSCPQHRWWSFGAILKLTDARRSIEKQRVALMKLKLKQLVVTTLVGVCSVVHAQDTHFEPNEQQIPTPDCLAVKAAWEGGWKACTEQDHDAWLADIRHWRNERLIRVGYDGSRYDMPALKWTQSSFFQPQMMVQDRYFYDPIARRYTVDRYLDDLEKRYGGIDTVLIWPTYPNMGIDDRNHHDLIRSMPGGVAGVRQMIADFHKHGVG